jgi:tetratricopeptide (TPR) repeat protein
MSINTLNNKVALLFQQGKWAKARKLLEEERERDPNDHWVVTQLGVTFYEEHRYQEALESFLASLQIVPDCPLTLWNAAGALDSLGQHARAVLIYTWLLRANISPNKDPCWESKERADALKTDCVYRLGLCFEHLGKRETAEHCYRQYMNLLATGIEGTYPVDDVLGRVRRLSSNGGAGERNKGLRDAIKSTLTAIEPKSRKDRAPNGAPRLNARELLPGKLAASKR